MLLLEKPDLSKQQTRRLPAASMEQAFLIRRVRVSGCLAEVIQWIQSRRAMGVMSDHNARAFGAAIAAMPRVGSFALAFGGRVRKVQEPSFALSAGRQR